MLSPFAGLKLTLSFDLFELKLQSKALVVEVRKRSPHAITEAGSVRLSELGC